MTDALLPLIITIPFDFVWFWGGIIAALWRYFVDGMWTVTWQGFGIWFAVYICITAVNVALYRVIRYQRVRIKEALA